MRALFTCAAIFALSIAATSSTMTAVEGVLTGESSGAIRGAYVLVHDSSPGSSQYVAQNWEMRTGEDGRFSFKLPSGCYDFFVSATFFFPYSDRVCVHDGRNDLLKLKLKADKHVRLTED